jgi:hypothetical protein
MIAPHRTIAGRLLVRFALATVAVLAIAGCYQVKNPDFCCEHDCEAHGAAAPVACDSPRVCDVDKFTCVDPTNGGDCRNPEDCVGTVTPFCVTNVCKQCEGKLGCSAKAPVCGADNACAGCAKEGDCADYVANGTPHCGANGECVQCRTPMDCSAAGAPVCDTGVCRGCQLDSECASNACDKETGACVAENAVIYLAPGGATAGTCTKATPCNTFALGITQLGGVRNVIKAAPGTYAGQIVLNNATVTIYGEGATATPTTNGQPVVVIGDGSNVTIDGLHITGAGGTGTPVGVVCSTVNGSKLRLHRTSIDGNVGGGVKISSCEFELVNNFIVQNGGAQSLFGGVLIQSPPAAGLHALDFNTIAGNTGIAGKVTGVHCDSIPSPVTFNSNIIYANQVSTGVPQADGSGCNYAYSDLNDTMPGTGNITSDPAFANTGAANYHLGPGSLSIDAADPTSMLGIDADGDKRPKGNRRDIGADESM